MRLLGTMSSLKEPRQTNLQPPPPPTGRPSIHTCPEEPVDGPQLGLGQGSAGLPGRAGVGRGGGGVGLRGELRGRVAAGHQHLGGAHQADAVLAGEHHGLLDDLLAHRAVQLLLHALHVGLGGRRHKRQG